MTDLELNDFIERMGELGDEWEKEDAKRVYGDRTLAEALNDRMSTFQKFTKIIDAVINR